MLRRLDFRVLRCLGARNYLTNPSDVQRFLEAISVNLGVGERA